MTRRFLLISLAVLLAATGMSAQDYVLDFDGNRADYAADISMGRAAITGTLLLARQAGGAIRGTLINEFGIRAFDFEISPNRAQVSLTRLMEPIDRRIVRRMLCRDLRYLFRAELRDVGAPSRRYELRMDGDDMVVLTNRKRHVVYMFSPQQISGHETTE